VCAYRCVQLSYTTQHRTVQIIFPLILQTIIIAQMMSTGGKGDVVSHSLWCLRTFWCHGLGILRASAAALCTISGRRTCPQHFDGQNLRCTRSNVSSRPICSSTTLVLAAAVLCVIVRHRRDCLSDRVRPRLRTSRLN